MLPTIQTHTPRVKQFSLQPSDSTCLTTTDSTHLVYHPQKSNRFNFVDVHTAKVRISSSESTLTVNAPVEKA